MEFTLNKENFDNLSDDLFSDNSDDDFLNTTKIGNFWNNIESQESEQGSYATQKLKEKRRLFEIYMADPLVPADEKTEKCFLMTLYKPQYRTQKLYALRKNLTKSYEKCSKEMLLPQKNVPVLAAEDFGYDNTFFAPKEDILAEQRKIAEIPKPLKQIYDQGIVTASQVFKIEQKLNCDSNDDDNLEKNVIPSIKNNKRKHMSQMSKSLLELSQTLSEQHEISEILRDIGNMDELDLSLSELTEKLQNSKRAAHMIDFTVSCSQRMKILEELQTCKFDVNTCDILSNENESEKSFQNRLNDLDNDDIEPLTTRNVNDKAEKKEQTQQNNEESSSKILYDKNENELKFKNHNNPTGFMFASGKAAVINTSKFEALEKKFWEEEEKLKNTEKDYSANSQKLLVFKADNKRKETYSQSNTSSQRELSKENDIVLTASQKLKEDKTDESASLRRIKSRTLLGRKPKKVKFDDSTKASENDKESKEENESFRECTKNLNSLSKSPSESIENLKNLFKNGDSCQWLCSNKVPSNQPVQNEIKFSFASGKSIAIKNSTVEKFKNIFEAEESKLELPEGFKEKEKLNEIDVLQEKSLNNKNIQNVSELNISEKPACLFSFASGKTINIDQSKLSSIKRKFAEISQEHEQLCKSDKPDISNEATNSLDSKPCSSNITFKGKDSGLSFSSYRMNSRRMNTGNENDDIFTFGNMRESSQRSQRGTKRNSQISKRNNIDAKVLDSGNESQEKQSSKAESPQKAGLNFKSCFMPSFTSSPIIKPNKNQKPNQRPKKSLDSMITPGAFKRSFNSSQIDDDEASSFKAISAKRLPLEPINSPMISPIPRKIQTSIERNCKWNTPVRKRIDTKASINNKEYKITLNQRLEEFDEFMTVQSQFKLYGNDPTVSQFKSLLDIEKDYLCRFETENKIKRERREGINEQMKYIDSKPEEDARQMTGTLFMMKSGAKRMTLKTYVKNENPLERNIHEVNIDDILKYRFDMKDFLNDPQLTVSTTVGDNAKLFLDCDSKVGFHEIKYSFLSSYGVDPKLTKDQWIENAYQMIFIKLAWMENSFDKFNKFDVLSPENILLQLKYRYDREIDRSQRPALRKITEMDEAPNRRIVLKVINIIYSLSVGYELDLSDGWYKIRSCVDSCLADAISRKKIILNTKLIICNAELISLFSTGCSPLELPSAVRLKIYGNSTRIAKWNEKLGFCRNPTPFLISLDYISNEGVVIGRLKLFIVHVYSIIYVESNGEKKEFRSEKMQNRIEHKKEILYSTLYEKIHKQVMDETFNELKERARKIDKSRINLSKMSIADICDILEYEGESDLSYMIRSQLTIRQVERIQELYNQRKCEMNQRIKDRINENENNVAQLLKFRVVDAMNPQKTALVSWWRPSEELLNIIKVGNSIEIQKASSAGRFQAMYSGEIQIHADNSTTVKLLKVKSADEKEKFKKFIRRVTKFEDLTRDFSPLNNEFDIVCMIVHVNEKQSDGKCTQKVYAADEKMNFIILNFYPSLVEYAYDDVFIEGKILYMQNLQWRRLLKDKEFPEAHAVIDSTLFISNPRDDENKRYLHEFQMKIGDEKNHLKMCQKKLESIGCISIKSKINTTVNVRMNTSELNTSRKRFLGMKRLPNKYGFS